MGQWRCGFGFLPTHLPSQPWGGLSHQSWCFTSFDSINWLIKNKQIRKINTWTYICWQELPESVCVCVCLCVLTRCVSKYTLRLSSSCLGCVQFSVLSSASCSHEMNPSSCCTKHWGQERDRERESQSIQMIKKKNSNTLINKHCCPDPAGVTSKQHLQNTGPRGWTDWDKDYIVRGKKGL